MPQAPGLILSLFKILMFCSLWFFLAFILIFNKIWHYTVITVDCRAPWLSLKFGTWGECPRPGSQSFSRVILLLSVASLWLTPVTPMHSESGMEPLGRHWVHVLLTGWVHLVEGKTETLGPHAAKVHCTIRLSDRGAPVCCSPPPPSYRLLVATAFMCISPILHQTLEQKSSRVLAKR